ncbi:hypothetical protein D3C81_1353620 [compost metagenome]
MQEAVFDTQRCQIAMLKKIIRAEHQCRRARQTPGIKAFGKVTGHERRAGQGTVTHGPQKYAARTSDRTFATTQARRHLTRPHTLETDLLILDHQVQQNLLVGAKPTDRPCPPGGQAVGVEGDAQTFGHALLVQRRHLALQIALQQPHLLYMVEQAPADIRRAGRIGAYQYRLPDPCFEQLDALRNRRLRQPQHLRRTFETGLFDDRGEGGKQFVVEHYFS